ARVFVVGAALAEVQLADLPQALELLEAAIDRSLPHIRQKPDDLLSRQMHAPFAEHGEHLTALPADLSVHARHLSMVHLISFIIMLSQFHRFVNGFLKSK